MILALLVLLSAPGECVCEPITPGQSVILMSEQTCALKLGPVVRALEGCNRLLDSVSTATTAIAALPPPAAPPAPSSAPLLIGALLGSGVGAGVGAGIVLTDTERPIPLVLGAVAGAVLVGALGAGIGWMTND